MGEAKRRREILGDRYGRPTKFVQATKAQAVVAYIERNGRLLSVSRKDTGEHAVPGGKVEPGETLLLALAREVREETGLEIANAVEVYRGPHTSGREVVAFRCEAFGEPEALEEGTRVEWVSPEQIAEGFGAAYHRIALIAAGCLPAKARAADEPCETPGCILGVLHSRKALAPNESEPSNERNESNAATEPVIRGRNRRNVLSPLALLSLFAGSADPGPAPRSTKSRRNF